jgi:hypothetical protein
MSDDDKATVTDPAIVLSNNIDHMVLAAGLSLSDVFHALTMSIGVVAAHPALDATPSEELADHVRLVVRDIIDEARHYRRTAERTPS